MHQKSSGTAGLYPMARQSLADQAYTYIKRMILSGELKGGERIPENSVAEQFGVSRTPIREALKKLESYGLIRIKPRSYAVVVEIPAEEADQIAVIRAQLERLSTRLITANGDPEDFVVLERLADQCNQHIAEKDLASTFETDSRFHLEIARRSKNRHLYKLFKEFDAKVQLLRSTLHLPYEKLWFYIGQHHQIIKAMKTGDSDLAESLMERHIMDQLDDYTPKGAL